MNAPQPPIPPAPQGHPQPAAQPQAQPQAYVQPGQPQASPAPQGQPAYQQPQAPQGFIAPQQPVQPQAQPQGYAQPQAPAQQPFQQPGQAPPMDAAALFKGIEEAVPGGTRENMRPGTYWLRVDLTKTGQNSKKGNVPYAVVDFTVIKVLEDNNGMANRVGSEVGTYVDQSGFYFLKETRGFLGAIWGCGFEAINEAHASWAYGPEQPLTNLVVECRAYDHTTKAGKVITKQSWTIGAVTAAMLLQHLTPEEQARFFPEGYLQQQAAAAQG